MLPWQTLDRALTTDGGEMTLARRGDQFVIRVDRRDALRDHLTAHRVGTEIYYPVPFHRQDCFRSFGTDARFPEADRAAAASLALPIYGELTLEQQQHVVSTIADFYEVQT